MKAYIVDSNYGSVSVENQQLLVEKYKDLGIDLKLKHFQNGKEIAEDAADANILLCTGNPEINAHVLSSLKDLQIVMRFGVGVNSVDLEAATKNNVTVLFMPGFCDEELAVHAAAMILGLIRNLNFYDRGIRKGDWPKAKGPVPSRPKDLVIGLYGFGASAKKLYDIFHDGFGSRVLVCDPYISEDVNRAYDIEIVDFDILLSQSDVVSIHAPLTQETKHIFNKDAFAKMKDNAMIVNVSRGPLIHQKDLEEALINKTIGFAGLDVFEEEPLKDSPLKDMDNVFLTPHSAFYGKNAQKTQLSLAYELIREATQKKRVPKQNVANKEIQSKVLKYY